ncbi:uncharacterized protein LOC127712327 [Mytilus californianus]|uniref:uncharacterized protein LOC127712327 n=1 Tax=Mytilus californianus TaxID=6549 RepID=UPI0022476B11|nr:uncharacterized protein LOC127712327 [Mytilus californianus]XP_052074656.1 uncharacterized protein LOC127712327 [Mytilus californianus]
MVLMLWLQIVLVISACIAYDMKCPVTRQWQYRAKSFCTNETKYVCLFHEMKGSYEERCIGPDGIQRGFKLVLRPNVLNSQCDINRYQPIPFLTTENSDCVYRKSVCNDEGLIVHNIGTNASDITCRCDYQRGYTFVIKPKNICYCLPSEEDCSCFLITCAKLTSDYACLQNEELSLGRKCPTISNNLTQLDKEVETVFYKEENDLKPTDSDMTSCIIISSLIVVFIISTGIAIAVVDGRFVICVKDEKNETQSDSQSYLVEKQHMKQQPENSFESEKNGTKEIQSDTQSPSVDEKIESHSNAQSPSFDQYYRQTSQGSVKESTQKKFMKTSLEVWEKMDGFYFETSMFPLVMDALETSNCVTLIGASGEGKTVSAIHAALQYRQKSPSFEVLEIFNPNELIKSIDVDKQQFFLVNDPLGKQCLNESSLGDWVQMSKRLKDVLAGGHIKIVSTIRKPLFKKNEIRIKETIFREYIIDFSSEMNRLSIKDKNGILAKSIKHTGKHLDCKIKNKMTTDTYHPGFPLFCHLICSNPHRYRHDTVDPCSVLIEELKEFLTVESFHYCCIVLAFMHDNVFDINDLTACEDIEFSGSDITDTKKILSIIKSCQIKTDDKDCFEKLKSGFEALSGAYFINNNPVYKILHDSITSAVAYTYGMANIVKILKYSGSSIIREYVRTKQSKKDDDNMIIEIIVSSKFQRMLANRFIQDIELGDSANVFLNPSFIDEEFQSMFLKELMSMDKSKMLKIMSTTSHEVSQQLKDIREYTKFALDVAILSAAPVHWLCRLGLCEILKAVLSKTEDKLKFLNELKVHTTPLHFAAGYGKIDVVRYLISIDVDINVKSQLQMLENPKIGEYFSGFPPLLYAARQNHPDVVEYMLQHGANPNLVRDHGGSPMLLAADRGHTEVIKHLLKYHGDPNLYCDHGTTPIILAAQGGHLESLTALIDGKADLNWQRFESEGKISALLAAAKNGHMKCVEVLINRGADIELSDVNGSSPLLLAIQNHHFDTARALFKLGASINAVNNSEESPLQFAKLSKLDFNEDA